MLRCKVQKGPPVFLDMRNLTETGLLSEVVVFYCYTTMPRMLLSALDNGTNFIKNKSHSVDTVSAAPS